MGLSLPRTAAEMAKTGDKVSKQELMPGDLVFFNTLNRAFSHVGIYLGNSQFLHSPSTGGVVRVESMDISLAGASASMEEEGWFRTRGMQADR